MQDTHTHSHTSPCNVHPWEEENNFGLFVAPRRNSRSVHSAHELAHAESDFKTNQQDSLFCCSLRLIISLINSSVSCRYLTDRSCHPSIVSFFSLSGILPSFLALFDLVVLPFFFSPFVSFFLFYLFF